MLSLMLTEKTLNERKIMTQTFLYIMSTQIGWIYRSVKRETND